MVLSAKIFQKKYIVLRLFFFVLYSALFYYSFPKTHQFYLMILIPTMLFSHC